MKRLQIFRTGTHTSTDGTEASFGESQLAATARVYDPKIHEAPLTIGHPRDNLPAYGWVRGLDFADGNLEATPDQVEPQFAEMVNAGRFKKISASFYTPESPSNPVPGSYYLRHVAFLGAQPPAVKGMRDASFNEDEQGVVEFEDSADFGEGWLYRVISRLFKGQREHLIDKYDTETADRVLPAYLIEDIDDAANRSDTEAEAQPAAAFTEPANEGKPDMTDKDIKIAEREAELERRETELAAKEAAFSEREKAAQEATFAQFADKAIAENKATPAERGVIIATMRALTNQTDKVEFGEGSKAEQLDAVEAYKRTIEARKPAVDFSERSGADTGGGESDGDMDATELAEKAQDYREAQQKKGRSISITQAVQAVRDGKAA